MKPKELKTPYQAGYDAAVNGPDTINCNFRWFNTKENTRKWEQGNLRGKKTKKTPK